MFGRRGLRAGQVPNLLRVPGVRQVLGDLARVQPLRGHPRRAPRPHRRSSNVRARRRSRCWASTRSASLKDARSASRVTAGVPPVLLAGDAGQQRLDLGEVVDDVVRGAPDGFVQRVHPLAVGGQPGTAVPGQPGGGQGEDPLHCGHQRGRGIRGTGLVGRAGHARTVRRRRFGRDRNVPALPSPPWERTSPPSPGCSATGPGRHDRRADERGGGHGRRAGPHARASGPRPPASTWPGWWTVAW